MGGSNVIPEPGEERQMLAHYLSSLVNALAVLALLFLAFGPRRTASLARTTRVKLTRAVGSARALAKQAAVVLSLGLWR